MKAKLLILGVIASLSLAAPEAFAKKRVVRTSNGQTIVTGSGNHHWNHYSNSRVSIGVGLGFGSPFFGGYYGGYPGYYGGYNGGYPYGGYGYYNGYPYGAGSYSGGANPYYYNRGAYIDRGYNGSVVARVQQRLARAGFYRGAIDGVMGPRTRYAIRVYERSHGLPAGGVIDRRLLATMGLA